MTGDPADSDWSGQVTRLTAENESLKRQLYQVQADFHALEASAKLEKSHRERTQEQYELVQKGLNDLSICNPKSNVANGDTSTESMEEYKERTNKQLEQLQAQNQLQSTLLQQMEHSFQKLQEESEKRMQELKRQLEDENRRMFSSQPQSLDVSTNGTNGVASFEAVPPAPSPGTPIDSKQILSSGTEETQRSASEKKKQFKEPKSHSFLENALRNRKQLIVSDPENSQGALLKRALQSKKSSSSSLSVPSPEPLSEGETPSQGSLLKKIVMSKQSSEKTREPSTPKLPVPAQPAVGSQSSFLEAAIQKQQKQKKGGFWDNILPMGSSPKPTVKKSTAKPSTPAAASATASTPNSIGEKWRQHRDTDAAKPQLNLHPEREGLSGSLHQNSLSNWGLFQRASTTTPTSQDSFAQLDDSSSMLSTPMAVVDKFFKKSPPSQRMLREDKEFEAIMKMAADRTRGLSEEELNRILESGSPKAGEEGEEGPGEEEDISESSGDDDDDFVDSEDVSESEEDASSSASES
eukprot:Nitzschia sp. Nitz4//scaffold175_size95217//36515//38083//NITZ4_004722-RA/size95217-processed-gene-0.67-mRNA-1//-1//CDS//3329538936//410//frame0